MKYLILLSAFISFFAYSSAQVSPETIDKMINDEQTYLEHRPSTQALKP